MFVALWDVEGAVPYGMKNNIKILGRLATHEGVIYGGTMWASSPTV